MSAPTKTRTAAHRPATRKRRFKHDDLIAVDLFSGFGGLSQGIERAGFTTVMAANHNPYKIEVHEANHPHAEHWIADLVDPDSSDYHSAADLPGGDILVAGISCTSHTQANTQKAYALGLGLFELDEDEEYEARVTRSERDRATALCVLQYAARHRPRMILVECTTEFQSWGPGLPNKPKIGDGSTYRWWLREIAKLEYAGKILFLNSQFFGVPQSRDRWFGVFWDKSLPAPDLDHEPLSWCGPCDQVLPAVWTWKTGIPRSGSVRYGKQYIYTCPRCGREVIPSMAPAIDALDLSNLGTRIGDRTRPLAPATMARADRCRQRFGDFPAIILPAKATHGVERHPWQPVATQTSQQETAMLATGAIMAAAGNTYERPGSDCRTRDLSQPMWAQTATDNVGLVTPPTAVTGHVVAAHRHNGDGQHIGRPMVTVTSTHEKAVLLAAVDNYQGIPRGMDEALPTQGGSETLALVTAGVLPFRKNTVPTVATGEAMPTVTADQIPGLITAAGIIKNNGSIAEAGYRAHPVSNPLGALVASTSNQALMTSGWGAQSAVEWRQRLAELSLEDCYFRMLGPHEVGRGCGFDVDFGGRQGTFTVWGSARDQVDGFGNAVSPAVGEWIGHRLRAVLDSVK
jgi:site-specific DNA-cytosine methylase